jgi:beta-phosphoglucomutase
MGEIRAFIFDLDGVITDTAEYHFLAWKRLADDEGLPFTREDNEQLRGVSRRESLLRLLKGVVVAEDIMAVWMERKNDYYKTFLDDITPANALPGVTTFLEDARQRGIKCAIGSASKNAKSVLEKLELIHMFDVIGDGFSVVNQKPAPDLFVWAAGGLHVAVNEAVVFEDAEAGINAAKAAGCYSVGIGTANVNHADMVLPDGLANVTLQQVLSELQAHHSNRE